VTGDEANFAGWLKGELTPLGVEASSAEFAEGRPNVWGIRQGRSGADTLLLIGHTDTVHTRGWKERWAGSERESPFSGAVVDGAVWGRGSTDLKAGICMTLEAVRTLDRAGIEVDPTLLFAFVGDEESGEPGSGVSAGARAFTALIAAGTLPLPNIAIYVEPTMLDIYAAHMGFFLCDIRTIGKSAYFGVSNLASMRLRVRTPFSKPSGDIPPSLAPARNMRWSDPSSFCRPAYRAAATSRSPASARSASLRRSRQESAWIMCALVLRRQRGPLPWTAASNWSFSTRLLATIRLAANPLRAASTKRAWGASFLLFTRCVLSGEILKPLPIGRNCRSYRRSAFRASILRRGISGSATRRKRTLASRTITTASSPSLRFWREPIVVRRFVQSNESGVSAPRLGAT
jgi:hypothetical protein